MQVETITVNRESAHLKWLEYSQMDVSQKTDADWELEKFYDLVSGGAKLLDIEKVFRAGGLHENGLPKLAIAKADKQFCYFHKFFGNGCGFSGSPRWVIGKTANIVLTNIFDFSGFELRATSSWGSRYRTVVPHIPPDIRPLKSYLKDYHILFEVEDWQSYNRDPLLLKRVNRRFFEVIAEWELSELEAMILSDLVNTI